MKVISLSALLGVATAAQPVQQQQQGKCMQGTVPIDLTFIVDESGSVKQENYDRTMKLISDVTSLLDVDSGKDQVAMISFASGSKVEFELNVHETTTQVQKAMQDTTWDGADVTLQWTCPGAAFKDANEHVICPTCPGRRSNAKNIVVILTDGNPSPKDGYNFGFYTQQTCLDTSLDRDYEESRLKSYADRVVPVGFGEQVTEDYLSGLSHGVSDTSTDKYLDASFEAIDSVGNQGVSVIAQQIADISCETFPDPQPQQVDPPQPQVGPCLTEKSTPFHTGMFNERCDPYSCPEWDCQRWCTCFRDHVVRDVFDSAQCKESLADICVDDDEPCDCTDF
jgi:hypothetical protein